MSGAFPRHSRLKSDPVLLTTRSSGNDSLRMVGLSRTATVIELRSYTFIWKCMEVHLHRTMMIVMVNVGDDDDGGYDGDIDDDISDGDDCDNDDDYDCHDGDDSRCAG